MSRRNAGGTETLSVLPSSGVEGFHDLFELLRHQLGVKNRPADVRMPKVFLDSFQVPRPSQEFSRTSVSEGVGMDSIFSLQLAETANDQ